MTLFRRPSSPLPAVFLSLLLVPLLGCGAARSPTTAPSSPHPSPAFPAASLQIHYIDVGQGDAAILVAPNGETVMFDDGVSSGCGRVTSYLRRLGLTSINYHIASHYHADHIGCASEVFGSFPLSGVALDRGGAYSSATFNSYIAAVGMFRHTVMPGSGLTLDSGSSTPVRVEIVASNGNGITTDNENALSVVAVVHFSTFDAEFGGDLTGFAVGGAVDVESSVARKVGRIEVYKVHHHGSRYSSNATWLSTTSPKVGIISVGNDNSYGHPALECLDRLHAAGVRTYWTEVGAGAAPGAGDIVAGDVRIDVDAAAGVFTVGYGSTVDTYSTWEGRSIVPAGQDGRPGSDRRRTGR